MVDRARDQEIASGTGRPPGQYRPDPFGCRDCTPRICRKIIILDLTETDALHTLARCCDPRARRRLLAHAGSRSARLTRHSAPPTNAARAFARDRSDHRLLRKTGNFSSAARLAPGRTMSPPESSSLRLRKGTATRWPLRPVKSPTARTTKMLLPSLLNMKSEVLFRPSRLCRWSRF